MSWIKNLFKKISLAKKDEEKLPEEYSLELSELSGWLNSFVEHEFEKIKPDIEDNLSALAEQKSTLFRLVDELESAALHNPDISEKEKQIMEGNRVSFIAQHKQFLNAITFSEEINCLVTSEFCKNFEEALVRLAKSTARNQAILSQFFADHVLSINKSIKLMGDAVNNVRELLDDNSVGIDDIDDIQKSISEIKAKKKILEELEQELDVLNKKLSNSIFMRDKFLKKKEELKQTDSYLQFQNSSQQREELWKQLKSCEEEIGNIFSLLNKPMRKFERMLAENVHIIQKYIEAPVDALVFDDTFTILLIFEKMKCALESGSLEVKEKEKTLQKISEVQKERLQILRIKYVDAKSSIKRIDDEMRNKRVLQELDDFKYKVEHIDSQLALLQDKIERAKKTRDKIDLEQLKSEVTGKIKDNFNVEVIIKE
jgi:hypothetical protein